ncbi:MAG: hypothetical protein ABEI77_04755 [Halorientalis sp.]
MPTCPGCNEHLHHARLPAHERFCEGITGRPPTQAAVCEYFETRLATVERHLDAHLALFDVDDSDPLVLSAGRRAPSTR